MFERVLRAPTRHDTARPCIICQRNVVIRPAYLDIILHINYTALSSVNRAALLSSANRRFLYCPLCGRLHSCFLFDFFANGKMEKRKNGKTEKRKKTLVFSVFSTLWLLVVGAIGGTLSLCFVCLAK